MASPNVRDILSVPGRLSYGPTNLTTAYPHGGTALGIVQEVYLKIDAPTMYVEAEEYGGEKVEGFITREGCALGFILRSWDRNALSILFPNTVVGATAGKRRVASPSTIRAGEPLSNRSVVLVFTPDDTDRHAMFLMRRALPAIETTTEVRLRLDEEFGIPAIFHGIRDTSGRLYEWGVPHDLQAVL
jgi:hypothetical protein